MDESADEAGRIAALCPAAIDVPGLSMPCPCADYAEKLGEPPPRDLCPASETLAEMIDRHSRELDVAHAATARELRELSRAIRDAENRADALAALSRRGRGSP